METTKEKSIRIVGLAVETQAATAASDIGALWQRAGAAGVLSQNAPNYGVYTAYESDKDGRYKVIVGSESSAEPKEGQELVEIPVGEYRILEDEGAVPAIVGKAWQHVWENWEADRSYQLDYEEYVGTPEHSKFKLAIGIK